MSDGGRFEPPETPEERLARFQAKLSAAAATAQAAAAEQPDRGSEVATTSGNIPAVAMKSKMAEHRAALIHSQNALKAAHEELKNEMDRQLRDAMEILGPIKQQVAQMEEGIWTVNLYLGRDEEITQLLDGEPAGAETPLTLRQTVLFWDEEVAALAEQGGMDYSDVDLFDEWISDPKHRDIVIPEAKGVVAIKPRRLSKDYGNSRENLHKDAPNTQTHFIGRNGDRLLRRTTGFDVGHRLVPSGDEFTSLVKKKVRDYSAGTEEYKTIEPGSREWMEAEKAADARTRHYMRIAMILQGLIDRTTVFHPINPTNLLQPEAYADGTVVMLADAELALTTGRKPFYEWLKELNADLRPGMRIVGAFGYGTLERGDRYETSRVSPRSAEGPESLVIHTIDSRRQGGLAFKYARTQKTWIRDEWGTEELRLPKTRASCLVFPSDKFIIAFDPVSIEDLDYYLNSRTERHAYADMMPLLHAVRDAKIAERDAEAPFRAMLAAQIDEAHGPIHDTAALELEIESLVDWWKVTNKHHRALVLADVTGGRNDKSSAEEGKALRMIVTEYALRLKADDRQEADAEAAAVKHLRGLYPDAMFIGRARDGKVVAFVPQPRKFDKTVVAQNVWIREVKVGITLKGKTAVRDFVLAGTRASKMRTLFENETWAQWDRLANPNEHLTDDELTAVSKEATEMGVDYIANGWYDRRGTHHAGEKEGALHLATTFDKKRKLKVYAHPKALPFNPDDPIKARKTHYVSYVEVEYRVKKVGSKVTVKRHSGTHSSTWSTVGFGDTNLDLPWYTEGARWHRPGLVEFHQEVFDEAMRVRAVTDERNKLHDALTRLVDHAMRSIEDQWVAARKAEQYARFLEDYADPSLWEGHEKTLKTPQFDHKYLSQWGNNQKVTPIYTQLTMLVEAGVDLVGMSVTEIAAAAVKLGATEWEVPEDMASIVIGVPEPDEYE